MIISRGKVMTVYFDMDRVLVDFAAQAEKYKILKRNQRVNWVKVFLYGEKFWSQMNFLYFADYYFRMISMYCAERNISVKILSSVRLKSGKKGKLNWCRKNLNLEKKDIILVKAAKNKYRYAEANSILIDDSIENIECFEAAGGNAFKFEKWNEITFNEICRKIDCVYERNRN